MIAPYRVPTGARLKRARQLFDAFDDQGALRAEENTVSTASRINFSRLYAFAGNPDPTLDPEVSKALKKDARLAADFCRILAGNAIATLPRVAAADTDSITTRDGEGCHIRMEPSEAEPDQIYVIIELNDPDAKPKNMILFDEGLYNLTCSLPPTRDGIIQLFLRRDDKLIRTLRHPRSEVYLQ